MPRERAIPPGASDRDLVDLAARGHRGAFTTLHERYCRFVLILCARYTRPHERELRRDAEQQVWTQLAEGKWRLRADMDGPLHAFLELVVKRTIANLRRAERRRDILPETFAADVPAPMVDALQRVIRAEQHEHLRAAIAQLTPRERWLLSMRYVRQLSIQAIAAHDGRTMSAVALHLGRIHRRLAAAVGGNYRPAGRGERFASRPLTRRTWNKRLRRRQQRRKAA
jgi:RNA polymerase sigma factor (sigma-70 family)